MRLIVMMLVLVLLIVLGLVIDVQSRPTVTHGSPDGVGHLISATGRIEGATPEIELRLQLTGRITEVLVHEGQFVEKGAVLLRLDDAQYRQEEALAAADLALAEAQLGRLLNGAHAQERVEAAALLRAKQAELERAQLAWRRTEELIRTRAVSQQEADNQRTTVLGLSSDLDAAKARLERLNAAARPDDIQIEKARIAAAQARLDMAKTQVARAVLCAPCRGQVLKVDVEPGELASPTSAEPAVIMADTSRFQVRAWVDELDAPRVQVGMSAKITADGLPNQQFSGQVSRLSPRMDRKQIWTDQPGERRDTKTREVWISLDTSSPLVVGLRVEVTFGPASAKPDTRGVSSAQGGETLGALGKISPFPRVRP